MSCGFFQSLGEVEVNVLDEFFWANTSLFSKYLLEVERADIQSRSDLMQRWFLSEMSINIDNFFDLSVICVPVSNHNLHPVSYLFIP
jgi:hypothetical protein